MSLLVQHGHGKGDKIQTALGAETVSGAILSPQSEKLGTFENTIQVLAENNECEFLAIDSQEYLMGMEERLHKKLVEYPHYRTDIKGDFFLLPRNFELLVANSIRFQDEYDVTHILGPTVITYGFSAGEAQRALILAREFSEQSRKLKTKKGVLASLVFHENALIETDTKLFLDSLTKLDVDGFYLIVVRNQNAYCQNFESHKLENLLRLVYSLAETNGYDIVVGYSDILGLLLTAVGAKHTACGWHHTLRQYNSSKFAVKTGGGQPVRPRYTSGPLLNSILVNPELQFCYDAEMIDEVISGTDHDDILLNSPIAQLWPVETSTLHHWEALAKITTEIQECKRCKERVDLLSEKIKLAIALYRNLIAQGAVFEATSNGSHLLDWTGALRNFRRNHGV